MNTSHAIERRDHRLVRALLDERNRRMGSDYEPIEWPETLSTGRKEVECIAKDSAGSRLAVEHTLVQPFVGKKEDDVRFMQVMGKLEDPSLRIKGFVISVSLGVGSIPKGDWPGLSVKAKEWFRENAAVLPEGVSTPEVPGTGLVLTIEKECLGDSYPGRVSVERSGPADTFDMVVRTALETRLPKLLQAHADGRILLVEKEDCYGGNYNVTGALERIGPSFAGFERLDEVWVVKTVDWKPSGAVWFGPVWPRSIIAYHGNLRSVAVPFG